MNITTTSKILFKTFFKWMFQKTKKKSGGAQARVTQLH